MYSLLSMLQNTVESCKQNIAHKVDHTKPKEECPLTCLVSSSAICLALRLVRTSH